MSTAQLLCVSGSSGAGTAEERATAPARSEQDAPGTALFARVVTGGGFSRIFTLLNTGGETLEGNLILTKSSGTPMEAIIASENSA
jgi:hypothetical protein